MEFPRLTTETPRHQLTKQIRTHLPKTDPVNELSGEALLVTLYRILKPTHRQQLEKIALLMAARNV